MFLDAISNYQETKSIQQLKQKLIARCQSLIQCCTYKL